MKTTPAQRNAPPSPPAAGGTVYTCPMHPEVQQDHPGACPECGMVLALARPTLGGHGDAAHPQYIGPHHGQDRPKIRNWHWGEAR